VLQILGVEDYGIYNVVGGVVAMLGFVNLSMAGATQRFLTFELGRNDTRQLQKVFSLSLLIHGLIAVMIVIIAETAGLWFFRKKMHIPVDRMNSAAWVYQLSILSAVIGIISVPYNAVIISRERMRAFAYISIIEIILKLIIVYILDLFIYDKLIVYAILLCMIQCVIRIIYGIYCKKHFEETIFSFSWDKQVFKKMIVFAFWTINGNLSGLAYNQGLNVLLNLFFGPSVNAARGIAVQVQSAVTMFCRNFQTAINPQITKSYAGNNLPYMHSLIFICSRFSFFLLFFLFLPIFLKTEMILKIWLKTVPEHTVSFVRLILAVSLFESVSHPLVTAIHATGKIKTFQLVEGTILLLILPLSYIFLKNGFIPEIVFVIHLIIEVIAQCSRMLIVCPIIQLSMRKYSKNVLIQIITVCILSPLIPLLFNYVLPSEKLWSFLAVCLCCCCSVALCSYCLGINKRERRIINNKCKYIIQQNIWRIKS
jgi:O-antigen/teichoic acid export membrane protein